jgi:hypothetical protein
MKLRNTKLEDAISRFDGDSTRYVICTLADNGDFELAYQGALHPLKLIFRHIRDTMKWKEGIGNHPKRDNRRPSK